MPCPTRSDVVNHRAKKLENLCKLRSSTQMAKMHVLGPFRLDAKAEIFEGPSPSG